jgi:branched-subunit amino acid ABC-type transport system permease component
VLGVIVYRVLMVRVTGIGTGTLDGDSQHTQLILTLGISLVLQTRLGRSPRAAADNPRAALYVGILERSEWSIPSDRRRRARRRRGPERRGQIDIIQRDFRARAADRRYRAFRRP